MKYYSEVLDTLFDSEEELNEAERIKNEIYSLTRNPSSSK